MHAGCSSAQLVLYGSQRVSSHPQHLFAIVVRRLYDEPGVYPILACQIASALVRGHLAEMAYFGTGVRLESVLVYQWWLMSMLPV